MLSATESSADDKLDCDEPIAWLENDRLAALAQFAILDTDREPQFDNIVKIASEICETPIAIVNFIADGRQWFKAETGIGRRELPLEVSICRYAILQPGLFVVPDLTKDARFAANPLVTAAEGLRFYAGALLETEDGLPLGTVCVLDTRARPEGLTDRQARLLQSLASQVMSELKLRVALTERDAKITKCEKAEAQLRLGSLVAGLGLGMIDYRDDTCALDSAAAALFDLPANTALARAEVHARFHPEDAAAMMPRIARMLGPDGEGFLTLEHRVVRPDGSEIWVSARKQITYEGEGQSRRAVSGLLALRDISGEKLAEEGRELLLHELNHRIKNIFALTSSLINLTARSAKSPQQMKEALSGRLAALAIGHDLIRAGKSRSAAGEETGLHELLKAISNPYLSDVSGQLKIAGPPVRLGINAATSLALVLHELATNAAKYGAFSHAAGQLEVAWHIAGDRLTLCWEEKQPDVNHSPPEHLGFGSRLVRTSVEHQLDGRIEFHWNADGVRIELNIPLAKLQS